MGVLLSHKQLVLILFFFLFQLQLSYRFCSSESQVILVDSDATVGVGSSKSSSNSNSTTTMPPMSSNIVNYDDQESSSTLWTWESEAAGSGGMIRRTGGIVKGKLPICQSDKYANCLASNVAICPSYKRCSRSDQ